MLGYQRKYLRSLAHHLKPIVIIGKNKITDGVISSINDAFNSSELIKIKFISKNKVDALKKIIIKKNKCNVVGEIGNVLILYKMISDPDKRKIKLPIK